jgi:hypothetical protein
VGNSLDHLVGAADKWQRNREAKRLRGLEIDDHLDFRRLLDRQVGRLLTLENPAGEDAYLAVRIRPSGAIANLTESSGR